MIFKCTFEHFQTTFPTFDLFLEINFRMFASNMSSVVIKSHSQLQKSHTIFVRHLLCSTTLKGCDFLTLFSSLAGWLDLIMELLSDDVNLSSALETFPFTLFVIADRVHLFTMIDIVV